MTEHDEDDRAEDAPPARSLAQYLELHNEGWESEDGGKQFAELVRAVNATGKTGTLTLTLQLKPSGDGIEATVQVSTKVPKPSPEPVVLYPDGRGNVTLQPTLPLDLPGGTSVSVSFSGADAEVLSAAAEGLRNADVVSLSGRR